MRDPPGDSAYIAGLHGLIATLQDLEEALTLMAAE
jgi:hypothetical protein